MSYQVRHFQPCSSRFRSTSFHSVAPPVEKPAAELQCSWVWPPQRPVEQPEAKKRKLCPKAAAYLDPALWKFLPDDLLEKVAAHLPFPGLFKCRAVSKRLKEFVFSEKFQEARACVKSWDVLSPKSKYLLMFATIKGENMCTAYDAVGNHWLHMPPMRGLDPRAKDCVAGDGGLLCFRNVNEQGAVTLFVYNPVTASCRELPPMHVGNSMTQHTWLLTHMIFNRFTSSYKLLVLTKSMQCPQACAHMEIYDSLTQTWTIDKKLSVIERKYKLSFAPQVGACCDNFFYFVAKEGILRSSVMGLVVYDIYEGVFREKLLYRCEPRCPGSKIEVQVVECKGTVYMVVREDDPKGTKGVSFCRLNPSKELKIEDAVLFESFFEKWGSVFPSYRCVSVRDELGLLLYDKSFQVLADDLSDELKLPPCPFQGLDSFVPSTKLFSALPAFKCNKSLSMYYATQNVVSEAHFQPNAAAVV
ncbi:hypothetical protein M758_3G223600 [Ceratodon purpureus]|nr:hypothetical protein M758_3G223600 [Ceratodon purpureus]